MSCQSTRPLMAYPISGDLNRSAQHIAFETKGVCDGTTTEAVFLCGRGERRDLQPMAQGRIWSKADPVGASDRWLPRNGLSPTSGHPSEANKTRPERGKRRRFGNFLELLNPAVKDVLRHQVRFKGWRAEERGVVDCGIRGEQNGKFRVCEISQ